MRVLDRGKCTVLLLSLACSAPSVCPAAYPGHPCSSRATEQHAAARVSPRQFGDHAHSSAHGRLHTACTCKGPGRRAQQARPPRGLSVLGDFTGTLARYEFAGLRGLSGGVHFRGCQLLNSFLESFILHWPYGESCRSLLFVPRGRNSRHLVTIQSPVQFMSQTELTIDGSLPVLVKSLSRASLWSASL